MKIKHFKIIIYMLILLISFSACNSKYNDFVKEYNNLYQEVVKLLDKEKIYESTSNNDLQLKLVELEGLLREMEKYVPNNSNLDYAILKERYSLLQGVIDKGSKWETLNGLEKFLTQEDINILKSNP